MWGTKSASYNLCVFDLGEQIVNSNECCDEVVKIKTRSEGGDGGKISCVANHGGKNCSNAFGINNGRCTFNPNVCMDYNGWFTDCVDINDGEQRALNIAKINLESKQISFITNDNISVNPITSPQQTNILINKSDQGWENYNIETGETNLIKNIDPYMHSNCITFIDEQTVVTYDENGHSYLINILSNVLTSFVKILIK